MPVGDSVPKIQPEAGLGNEFDIQKWLYLLLENRWWIIGFTTLCTFMAIVYSFLVTPIYSATATVYVQTQTRAPVGNQNLIGITSWGEEIRFYNSQDQVIRSRAVMEEVVERGSVVLEELDSILSGD